MSDWYTNGEFPPVGEMVLVEIDGKWIEVKVVAYSEHYAGILYDGEKSCGYSSDFKPIQSPQEQERDEFISDVGQLINDFDFEERQCDDCGLTDGRVIAAAIFNAGYRKVKPLSLRSFNLVYQSQANQRLYHWLINHDHIVESKDND